MTGYAKKPSIWQDRQQVLAIPLTEACYSQDHGECEAVECECSCHYEEPVWPTNGRLLRGLAPSAPELLGPEMLNPERYEQMHGTQIDETYARYSPTEERETMSDYGFTTTATYSQGRTDRQCDACGWTAKHDYRAYYPDGPVMRSHAKACPVSPREYRVPGVCDA